MDSSFAELDQRNYGSIVGLGVGMGVTLGLGVGHGFVGSSVVQGVGETVGVGTAACVMPEPPLQPLPDVTATPIVR